MGKVTVTIEFRTLEIVWVPHRICQMKKDLITAMYFPTPSAKTCSFSDEDLTEGIFRAAVLCMTLSENMY